MPDHLQIGLHHINTMDKAGFSQFDIDILRWYRMTLDGVDEPNGKPRITGLNRRYIDGNWYDDVFLVRKTFADAGAKVVKQSASQCGDHAALFCNGNEGNRTDQSSVFATPAREALCCDN